MAENKDAITSTPSNREKVKVGTRLSFNSDLCTVRYVGSIPPWSVTAYGVEWDDPERGKHSGMLNGVRYFDCLVQGAGSFVKATRLADPARSFEEAVQEKYLIETDAAAPVIRVSASKVIETYGADKIKVRQARLDRLETAFLIKMRVGEKLTTDLDLQSLKHLNLGYNLFRSAAAVVAICSRLPVLEILVLNGNRFSDINCDSALSQVKELSLSNTLTDPLHLKQWARIVPTCEALTLAYNNFSGSVDLSAFTNLVSLDLSYNFLTCVPNLPSIKTLILSHNEISELQLVTFESVICVDLSYNRIESWSVVDSLHTVFPNTQELRLNANNLPVTSEQGEEERERLLFIFILARWGGKQLRKLNGMAVSEREQIDAELYMMSKVRSGEVTYNRDLERWATLSKIYGEASTPGAKESISSKVLHLDVQYKDSKKQIKVLKNMTIQKLKAMIARSLKITGVLPQKLQIIYQQTDPFQEFLLDDDLMVISYYNIDPGATLQVELPDTR